VGEDPPFLQRAPAIAGWLAAASQAIVLGQQENVQDYLEASDVFVLPSRMEGLCNALMEAMAVELACVASAIGGNVDLIADGDSGLLFASEDVGQLAAALVRLLSDGTERRRLGRRAREVIEARYALDRVASRYVALYRSLLEGNR
jgi:glycosyltransferase involved in cell wall biosynthesis